MKDMGSSVLARLKNKARKTNKNYQQIIQLFMQEELLRRLAKSKYANDLILKGGLLIYAITKFESRETIDIDFEIKDRASSIENVKKMVDEILVTPTENDYVVYEAKGFEKISSQRKYPGISFQIIGHINQVRVPINVDIGIGDVIVPGVEKRKFIPQLEGFDSPEIATYSIESTVAEKFEAILRRVDLNSRMKDFFDISYLSNAFNFDGKKLQKAVSETLANRETEYSKDSLAIITRFSEDKEMNVRWNYFLRKLKVEMPEFKVVLKDINNFLEPVFKAIVERKEFSLGWDCKKRKWII
jgi:predicted nucleotidyltransferase component of viral defense system